MVIDYYACMCCAATDHCLMYREKWERENNTVPMYEWYLRVQPKIQLRIYRKFEKFPDQI